MTDKASPGDWRLPTREEWDATMVGKLSGAGSFCVPNLANDALSGCYGDGTSSSLEGVAAAVYWSATPTHRFEPFGAGPIWLLGSADLASGTSVYSDRTFTHLAWPARNGSR